MGEPPSLAGAVHETLADESPGLATTLVGAPGTVGALGVTALLGAENGLEPCALVASTTNWYVTPLTSPVMLVAVGRKVEPGAADKVMSATGRPLLASELCTV